MFTTSRLLNIRLKMCATSASSVRACQSRAPSVWKAWCSEVQRRHRPPLLDERMLQRAAGIKEAHVHILEAQADFDRKCGLLGFRGRSNFEDKRADIASKIASLRREHGVDTTTLVTPELEQAASNLESVTGITTSMLAHLAGASIGHYRDDCFEAYLKSLEAPGL